MYLIFNDFLAIHMQMKLIRPGFSEVLCAEQFRLAALSGI